MAKKLREFKIEQSPFYSKNMRLRAGLQELEGSTGKDVVLARKRYFKQDEYVKFIISTEFDIKKFYKLSNIAKTILNYIIYNCLEYNNPVFRFVASDLAIILDTDTSYIYKGVNDLIKNKYIARTKTKEVYWINHNLLYKGNFVVDKFLITKKT